MNESAGFIEITNEVEITKHRPQPPGGGGTAIPKRWGVPPEPHGAHGDREREIKKFRVTKREQFI